MNIPIFEALITDADDGIYKISLVDLPAVESNFLFFNKDDKALKFNIQDEDQHIVFGVLMRADYNIYRNDEQYGEYYIRYNKETIKKMAQKMLSDHTFNNINLMHVDGSDINGVSLQEIFIKDVEKGIDPKGFEMIEDGSLFCSYKVENPQIWEEIKTGVFCGFSLEGLFNVDLVRLNKHKNTFNTFMNRIFKKLMKSTVKMGYVETDKGTLYWVGDADLEIGDELFYNTEEQEAVKVEDGDYTLADGTVISVVDGLVSSIKSPEGEREEDLEKKQECAEETKEETVDETKEETVEETVEEKPDTNEIEMLKAEIEDLKSEIEAIKATLETVLTQPASEPVVEEYQKVMKHRAEGKGMNNVLNVVQYLKNNK